MNKSIATTILLLVTGNAHAHSHPGIDTLTHGIEHMLAGYGVWLPPLFAAGLTTAAASLLRGLWIRRAKTTGRRPQ